MNINKRNKRNKRKWFHLEKQEADKIQQKLSQMQTMQMI